MAKDRDDQLNHGSGSDELEFSLEEILAEYHIKERKEPDEALPIYLPTRQRQDGESQPEKQAPSHREAPAAPPSEPAPKARKGSVVVFPGRGAPPPPPDDEGDEEEEPDLEDTIPFPIIPHREEAPDSAPEEPSEPPAPPPRRSLFFKKKAPPQDEKVVAFPEEEPSSPLAAGINRLKQRADEYAEHMFEEEDAENDESVRRAERYIPGVDEEEPPRRERRPRREPPPAPDLPPQQLFRRYSKGLKLLRLRATLVFLLCLPMLYLTLAPYVPLPLPPALEQSVSLQLLALSILLGTAMLLGIDVWLRGLFRIFMLRMGMDSLMSLSCAAALADTLTLEQLGGREGAMPYCAAAALALGFAMAGTYLKRRGQRLACRTAASASEPYLVTLDDGLWNGRDTYVKWSGAPLGFGRQIQADDGADRIFHVTAPLLLICCLLFSLMSSVGRGRPQEILWCLSATLSASASFSGLLCYALPWNRLAQRLAKSGAALAGWDGVTGTGGRCGVLLTDTDLFPPGTISLNGIKVFGDFPVEKVVGVTATLIRESGSGLDKVFHDLLRTQGAIYRRCSDFCCYEGGGLSAVIRNESVLVGSADFMHLMEVTLPQGLHVKNAVFCAIDGELAGIFALNYKLHPSVEPALNAIIRNRLFPVLATRDFNILPAMLRQRFKLPADKMEFPPVERRVELSAQEQDHCPILSAVLCRQGVSPYAEVVVGAGRLRWAVRLSASLASLGAFIGVLLAFYITFMQSYASLSPVNLLVFLFMWLVPTWLISGWVNRY